MSNLPSDLPPKPDENVPNVLKMVFPTLGRSQDDDKLEHPLELNWLVEQLHQPDYHTRFWAVSTLRTLAKFVNHNTNEVTLRSRMSEDSRVAELARYARKPFQPLEAFQPLTQLLNDPVEVIRVEAVKALGLMAFPQAFNPLTSSLADESIRVRQEAILSLGMLQNEEFLPTLFNLLKNPQVELRREASKALGRSGYSGVVEALIVSMSDPDDEVRHHSARALGTMENPRTLETLLNAMGDKYYWVRTVAAQGLGRLRDKKAFEVLVAALDDPEYMVSQAAAWALGDLGDTRAVEPLIAAVVRGDRNVYQAARSLGQLGDLRAIEPLLRSIIYFRGSGWGLILGALYALGEPARKRVLEAVTDPDEQLREAAFLVLQFLIDHRGGDKELTLLLASLDAPWEWLQLKVVSKLEKLGDPKAIPALQRRKQIEPRLKVRAAIDQCLTVLENGR